MQEVSRVRSTKSEDARFNPKLQLPIGKEQIQRKKLHPQYVAGFIDGDCFNGLRQKTFVR